MNIQVSSKSVNTYRGDSFQITAVVTDLDTNGGVVNLTGATTSITCKRSVNDADTAAVFQYKSSDSVPNITQATPTNGTITAKIPSAGTMGLPQGSQTIVYFDIHAVLSDGSRWTVMTGTITVNPSVLAT